MHGGLPKHQSVRSHQPRGARRWIGMGVICLTLLGGLYLARDAVSPRKDEFLTAEVKRGDIEETVTATGKIQPFAYVDVGAQASGQLNRILVKIGDSVKQGDLLAEIDPQVQAAKVDADEAQLAQYNANLVEQQANVEYAEAVLGRYAKLVGTDSVSKLTFDESRRDAKTAAAKTEAIRAEIKQMESTLKADRVALGYTKIFAPMSGTVVSVDAREGQTLNATYSTPQILRIADLTTMTVWTQVSEADVVRLKSGMPVYFQTLGHGGRRWSASLRQILPSPQKPPNQQGASDPNVAQSASANNVVLYTALFDADNAEGDLRPEMTAQVFFVTAGVKNAVIVPVSALHGAGASKTKTAVTLVDANGAPAEREVMAGLKTRFQAEILSGLAPGDKVVTGIKPGSGKSPLVSFHL